MYQCDLVSLERTNMICRVENRVKRDLASTSLNLLRFASNPGLYCPVQPQDIAFSIASRFNQGALVQYQYGSVERAAALCEAAIGYFARRAEGKHKGYYQACMVPPYINLGRLHGYMGSVEPSLAIFEQAYRYAQLQSDLNVLNYIIRMSDAASIFTGHFSPRIAMIACRLEDSARVLQVAHRYETLLHLLDTIDELTEYSNQRHRCYSLEVRSRSLMQLGKHDEAVATIEQCFYYTDDTIQSKGLEVLLSHAHWGNGSHVVASEILIKVEKWIERLLCKAPVTLSGRQLAYLVALEGYSQGAYSIAMRMATLAYRISLEIRDQSGLVRAAVLLLRLARSDYRHFASADITYWTEQLSAIALQTLFCLDKALAYWELGNAYQEGHTCAGNQWALGTTMLQVSSNLYLTVQNAEAQEFGNLLQKRIGAVRHTTLTGGEYVDESSHSSRQLVECSFYALMGLART